MCEVTARLAALEGDDESISDRIIYKSQEMRAFHQDLRKRITDCPPPSSDILPEKPAIG